MSGEFCYNDMEVSTMLGGGGCWYNGTVVCTMLGVF